MASSSSSSSHRRVSSSTQQQQQQQQQQQHHHTTETSPLLVVSSANDSFLDNVDMVDPDVDEQQRRDQQHGQRGQATVGQTILNLMKTCMGTGTLALAFACQQGGLVVFVVGLLALAAWNLLAVHLLVQCLSHIPAVATAADPSSSSSSILQSQVSDDDDEKIRPDGQEIRAANSSSSTIDRQRSASATSSPPRGTSTLGRVAWYAFSDAGLQALDVMMVILLLGIIVAYVSAVVSFIGDTPLSLGVGVDAVLTGLVMACLSLVPDMGYLSGASATGLVVLLSAFVVIAGYGAFGTKEVQQPEEDTAGGSPPPMTLWPQSLNGVSHWFGICVFGYGIVPLTYNLQESMKRPHHFVGASALSLFGVALIYILLGVGLYALFPNLTADVLSEIPDRGLLPIMTRLAMVGTIVATAPLLVVPCAELLEGKFDWAHTAEHRTVVRFAVVGASVVVAVLLPSFVQVLSFVGCFCVATVSFIMPPLLHLRLICREHQQQETQHDKDIATPRRILSMRQVGMDVALLSWGIIATVISSICTLRS